MLTHILESHYCGIVGLKWEDNDPPVVGQDYEQLAARAAGFAQEMRMRANMFRTNNILAP